MAIGVSKRFWKQTSAVKSGDGYSIMLDDRQVQTPAKAQLVVPTLALAKAISSEWDAQVGKIDPSNMPLTRTANSAIDTVTLRKPEIVDIVAAYGDADLLCYRAETPAGLIGQQDEHWNPLLAWAKDHLEVELATRTGIVHKPQSGQALNRFHYLVDQFQAFELAAFHDLVTLSGSLVIGFAASRNHLSISQLWDVSRIDESWQISQWGEDEEDAKKVAVKRQAFLDAAKFLDLIENKDG